MAERRLEGLQRVLGVNALFSTAYGNVGSSIYYALGPGRLVRARAHAGGLHDHRRDLLPDRRHLRRGDGDVPRGRRLVVVRAPRLQRVLVVLRRLGADAQLHDHDRHLGVLRPALHRRAVLGAAAPLARATSSAAIAIVALLCAINVVGVKEAAGLNIVLAVTDFMTQLLLVVVGGVLVLLAAARWSTTSTSAWPRRWKDFLLAIPIGMIAYTGIETISNMAEEARDETHDDPGRDQPRGDRRVRDLLRAAGRRAVARCRSRSTPDGSYQTLLGLTEEQGGYAGDPILGVVKQMDLGPVPARRRDLRRPARRDDPVHRHQRGHHRRLAARVLDGHAPPAARPPAPAAPASSARRGSGSSSSGGSRA